MKNKLFLFLSVGLFIILLIPQTYAQVGIGTVTPSETLDVIGNIEYSGALMPNNLPGTANEILLSGGANSPSVWGPEILNITQIASIGKFFVNNVFIANNVSLTLTVTDPNCVISSTCAITWHQLDRANPGQPVNFALLHYIVKAEAGQWVFYIENHTGAPLNTGFSFMAFY